MRLMFDAKAEMMKRMGQQEHIELMLDAAETLDHELKSRNAKGADLWALSDLCTPWCVHGVATLRIADHIAAGIDQIGDLAAAAGCDPYALHRVLTYLVGQGVFEEPAPGRFALNAAARGLLDPSQRLGLDREGIGGRMAQAHRRPGAQAWGTLLPYVRAGKPAYHEVFGRTFWEDLEAHPDIGASFDALIGPAGHGTPNPEVQITGGWESVRTVVDVGGGCRRWMSAVDVGGGTGAMLAQILRRWPQIHGTLDAG